MFGENAVEAAIQLLESIAVGKRKEAEEEKALDEWHVERIDRSSEGNKGRWSEGRDERAKT